MDTPWDIEFLPGGDALISEFNGTLRIFRDGVLLPDPLEVGLTVPDGGGVADGRRSSEFS